MNANTHVRKSERGQSLVEIALSMMVVLLLLTGAVEVGRAFFIYVSMRDAAGEGAVFGSIQPYVDANHNHMYDTGEAVNESGIQARASEVMLPILRDGTAPDAAITASADTRPCSGNRIAVTVTYTYPSSMPFFTGIDIPLTATVTNTILQPICP